ncbi:hypothetical protein [Lachnoanaerobaculum umeaense]|uniref:Uncharacterized protein n=1 Tax=Lachnoanaerobaculum umeaense TaxID=617123 RepID=A0A385PZ25_9FIRM|nr:hypothetical protein [Lachnoanaerobaculum umeaense]AYA99185.1 hypothetical protein D4A81_04095 [Lachnoanaerobaculum umeaense]PZW93384.1 hypothetical protein C7439_12645 [Lachnoanaerobaculum umeaense]
MQSNFVFLQNDFPVLYQIGIIAEKYLYTDSNACLIKLGMFGETVVNLMLQLDKISAPQTGICEVCAMMCEYIAFEDFAGFFSFKPVLCRPYRG